MTCEPHGIHSVCHGSQLSLHPFNKDMHACSDPAHSSPVKKIILTSEKKGDTVGTSTGVGTVSQEEKEMER